MGELKDLLKKKYEEMNNFHKNENNEIALTQDQRSAYYNKMKLYFLSLSKKKWRNEDAKSFIKNWIIKHKDRLVEFLKYP